MQVGCLSTLTKEILDGEDFLTGGEIPLRLTFHRRPLYSQERKFNPEGCGGGDDFIMTGCAHCFYVTCRSLGLV